MFTESEQNDIERFVSDDRMVETIKNVLLKGVNYEFDPNQTNKLLGEKVRSMLFAKNLIEGAFQTMESYRKIDYRHSQINEAR